MNADEANRQALAERYVALWNLGDDEERRRTIRQLWADDGGHVSPNISVRGHEELEARVSRSQHRCRQERQRRIGRHRNHRAPRVRKNQRCVPIHRSMNHTALATTVLERAFDRSGLRNLRAAVRRDCVSSAGSDGTGVRRFASIRTRAHLGARLGLMAG
jgi:hypothetical protein